ncbi:MAG: hypothetical protein P8016_02965 [Sedimentisphaerales bacterium]
MRKIQKFTVFNLVLLAVGLTIKLLELHSNNILFNAIADTITILVFAPILVSYILRSKYQKLGGQYFDERVRMIHKKAAFVGLFTMPLVLSFVMLVTFIAVGPLNSISINSLFPIIILSLLSINFAESIAIRVQYSRDIQGEQS